MIFEAFRSVFFDLGCFSSRQVYAWRPEFDKNNLGRWVKKGLLIKLRQGMYCFKEYFGRSGFELFIANRMYQPSYISLYTALSYYGLIPETVVQITSVTALKTARFENPFGMYTYSSVKPDLMFGYDIKPITPERSLLMATPEKSLIDLLYLYPFYNTENELEALRLDEEVIHENVNAETLTEIAAKIRNKELEHRVKLLLKIYLA